MALLVSLMSTLFMDVNQFAMTVPLDNKVNATILLSSALNERSILLYIY